MSEYKNLPPTPPEGVLAACTARNGGGYYSESIKIPKFDAGYKCATYELQFPDQSVRGDERFSDPSYAEFLEKFYHAGLSPLKLETMFIKIHALFDTDINEEDLKGIYERVMKSGVSCVTYWFVFKYISKGDYFVIMSEKAECNLKTYLEQNNLVVVDKIQLCKELAELVSDLHECGVYHGDLKPENILILNNKKLKITDFEGSRSAQSNDFEVSKTLGYFDENMEDITSWEGAVKHDLYALAINFIDILISNGTKREWMTKKEKLDEFRESSSIPNDMKAIVNSLTEGTLPAADLAILSDKLSLQSNSIANDSQVLTTTSFTNELATVNDMKISNGITEKGKLTELEDLFQKLSITDLESIQKLLDGKLILKEFMKLKSSKDELNVTNDDQVTTTSTFIGYESTTDTNQQKQTIQ